MNAIKKRRAPEQCGITASGQFLGDICPDQNLTYWKCRQCRLLLTTVAPPDVCPTCSVKCQFVDVTCYAPECGGPGNIDRRLL